MTPQDEARFKTFIKNFVDDCGFDPPFHLIVVGTNGSVSVQRHTRSGAKQVCKSIVASGFVAPLVLTIIAPNGTARKARVEIEAARAMQEVPLGFRPAPRPPCR